MLKQVKDFLLINRNRIFKYRAFSSQPEIKTNILKDENSEDSTKIGPFKESLKHVDYFHVADLFNVEDLFNAKCHFGHREGTLNPHMNPYIFGSRLGHLIIDLDKTAVDLRAALNFTSHIAFRGGVVMFVCRNSQHQLIVEKTAENCGEYSHCRFWESGMFTNSLTRFGHMIRLPDLLIFLNTQNDVLNQHEAVIDAAKMMIPSVGVVDTNCDPKLITYPFAGNDDTSDSIKLYCRLFFKAIMRAKDKRKEVLSNLD